MQASNMEVPHRPRQRKTYNPRVNPFVMFSEAKFIERYRLSKELVRALAVDYEALGYCSTSLSTRGGGLSGEERFALALRYFATGANYTCIGDFHGVHKSTVSHCINEVATFLYCRSEDYIQFPLTSREKFETAARFMEEYGRPLCLGAVDGTHVPILKPSNNEPAFINRKNYHSMNAMVICNSDKIITHVDPRFPGSVHDSNVLQMSKIHDIGETGELGTYYLLGDSGYPLRSYLFTPFRDPGNEAQEQFNRWHKHTRACVEATLGVLKQRFRCLDDSGGYLHHEPVTASHIIVACVCLHNIAMRHNMPQPIMEEDEDKDGRRNLPAGRDPFGQPPQDLVAAAPGPGDVQRREQFIRNLFTE